MSTISDLLAPDHKYCDELFAAAEAAVATADWEAAARGFGRFLAAMQHHFAMEEKIMFPAFEERTGMRNGPTAVMRSEHRQMDTLLDQLANAVAHQLQQDYLGDAETLLLVMQQHNTKEEQMLYRMADQVLAGDLDELVGRMRAIP
jgi:hemerythrin-like domain-containing protein